MKLRLIKHSLVGVNAVLVVFFRLEFCFSGLSFSDFSSVSENLVVFFRP